MFLHFKKTLIGHGKEKNHFNYILSIEQMIKYRKRRNTADRYKQRKAKVINLTEYQFFKEVNRKKK